MATHSSTLAWKIPWMEEPGKLYSPWDHKESYTTEHLHFSFPILELPGSSQLVKNPAMQETLFQFLGWGDPLEKEMATQSSILAWEIPRTEEPGGLQSKSQTQPSD